MINEDILGGLKSGLERGEPLNKVMMSLYNAGYKKDEIEEAAHSLSSSPVMENPPAGMEEKGQEKASEKTEEKPKKMAFPSLMKKNDKTKQKASDYGKTKTDSKKNKMMIIIMIVLAVIFVGVLALFLLTSK